MKHRPRIVLVAVLIAGVATGAGYGWLSGVVNRNPYYEPDAPVPTTPGQAWTWRPSPWWLPSYTLCVVPTNGYGITHTRSGYLFRTSTDRARYTTASAALGAVMGGLAGTAAVGAAAAARRWCRTKPP